MEGRAPATPLGRLIDLASPCRSVNQTRHTLFVPHPHLPPRLLRFLPSRPWARPRPGRSNGLGILLEIRPVNFVNGLEITKVGEENRCLHHVAEIDPSAFKTPAMFSRTRRGLLGDIVGNHLSSRGVERNLSGTKKHRSRFGSLANKDRSQPVRRSWKQFFSSRRA